MQAARAARSSIFVLSPTMKNKRVPVQRTLTSKILLHNLYFKVRPRPECDALWYRRNAKRWYPPGVGVFGAVLVGADYRVDQWTATGGGRPTVLLIQTEWTYHEFRVTCSERLYYANAVRMGSSNLSCATKSCACVSIVLLEGIRSLSVENSYVLEKHNATSSS